MDFLELLSKLKCADLIDLFKENKISCDILSKWSLSDAQKTLPAHRVNEFWQNYQRYFSKDNSLSSSSKYTEATCQPTNTERSPLRELNDANVNVNRIFVTENIDVHKILNDTFEGRNILNWYNNKRSLVASKRKKVVHLVVCAVLRLCSRDLKEADFLILRRKIVEVFPTELACIYYSPAVPKNKSPNGKAQKACGKLLNKYYNLQRLPIDIFKSANNEENQGDNHNAEHVPSEEEEASIEWLRTLEEPWETAKLHWKRTYKYRHPNSEVSESKLVNTIFESWPILKCSKGYELIDIDFDLSGLCKIDNAIENFSALFSKISLTRSTPNDPLCAALKELLNEKDITTDTKVYAEILLLSFMLPSTARISQGRRKYWKPSCLESFEGIITHVKIYGDIERTKEEKELFARSKRITLQPYIIIVGEEDFKVESTYLIIDNNEYEMPSLLKAIDCCFKSFHVFNAKYPPQSEHLWLLLQHVIYQFRTRWDSLILSVEEMLNDIQFSLAPFNSNKV